MNWRSLDLTANLLRERGLDVVAVWTPDSGLTLSTIYVRWQKTTSAAERAEAERFIFAETIHHLDMWQRPKGCPW